MYAKSLINFEDFIIKKIPKISKKSSFCFTKNLSSKNLSSKNDIICLQVIKVILYKVPSRTIYQETFEPFNNNIHPIKTH
jgi:hypothetical protein